MTSKGIATAGTLGFGAVHAAQLWVPLGFPYPRGRRSEIPSCHDEQTVSGAPPAMKGAVPAEAVAGERKALEALDRGDHRTALQALMDTYGDALYSFCLRMVRDPELAADVHQTVFVQAWEGFARYSRRSTLRGWLYGIARHRCLDALKSLRRRQKRFEVVEDLPEPEEGAKVEDPEERLAGDDLARALSRCLANLVPQVRLAILLRFKEGFSYPEMSHQCNERPATLQARVARALPVLRRCLELQGVGP